jgi:hypothetical protein
MTKKVLLKRMFVVIPRDEDSKKISVGKFFIEVAEVDKRGNTKASLF